MTADPFTPFDSAMMLIALRLARRGIGATAPNPAVGAVIADENSGKVVGRGWTQPGGRPHAETEAIRRAGPAAKGRTLYVTLEPCSHVGQTGPCADAVIAAGLRRVVAAIEDPDPRVAGRGLDRLRRAGVTVARGLHAAEARWVTRGHIVRVTQRRPLVTIKMALAADGSVPRGGRGQPQWVTGPLARAHGHLLRAEADAILVGGATVRDDDPRLDCRLPGLGGRSPVRVVLSRQLDIPLDGALVASARQIPLWLVCGPGAPAERAAAFAARGAVVITVAEVGGGVWLPAVMEQLVARGITRLLVEGGPAVWRAFARASLADEIVIYQPGAGSAAADHAVIGAAAFGFDTSAVAGWRRLGSDIMVRLRPGGGPHPPSTG